jgi:hypothetical protein
LGALERGEEVVRGEENEGEEGVGSGGLSSGRRQMAWARGEGNLGGGGPGSGMRWLRQDPGPVSCAAHVGVPGDDGEIDREGERRQAGRSAHGMGPIRQRNEERRIENGRWVRLRFNQI